MTFFYQYLLRLAICFAAMYLFYAIVLRRLTFYNHNRWYLLGYSLLCFIIPLINFSSDDTGIIYSNFVQMIPIVAVSKTSKMQSYQWFDVNKIVLWIFIVGIIFMFIKLLIQLLAYKKLTGSAKIISDDNAVKLYQLDKEIAPFSFGNSIFINRHLHDETALQEILQHEFVHVKQRHTFDILWGEVLCMLNWYNPFVWLIRKAIRENLEFIADNKVVQSGINKQQYQYLLLRVMGYNNFSFTNQFNFSSLKKRIVMMNKIKTAKIHLLKFLFLIPVLGILLVSFRDESKQNEKQLITTATDLGEKNYQSQNQDTSVRKYTVTDVPINGKQLSQVRVEAKFPGGEPAWKKYIHDNLKVNVPVDNGAPVGEYVVTVSFLVHKDGSLSDIKVVDAPKPDYGTGAEAVRIIQRGPRWQPAIQNGKTVLYRQKQRIIFSVKE